MPEATLEIAVDDNRDGLRNEVAQWIAPLEKLSQPTATLPPPVSSSWTRESG